jgi:hypothetical protein
MQITEIKRHLDGREERFVCDIIELIPGERAVLHYATRLERPHRDGPLTLPAGEIHTRAYFWADRHYLVYQMRAARRDGPLLGHRFDICEDVRISPTEIMWLDLIVDLWLDPRGNAYVLDEDELARYQSRRLLTERQLRLIEETKLTLLQSYRDVLAEIGVRRPPRGITIL